MSETEHIRRFKIQQLAARIMQTHAEDIEWLSLWEMSEEALEGLDPKEAEQFISDLEYEIRHSVIEIKFNNGTIF